MPTEHDPFAPHYVGGPYADDPDGFPARRLARAGLPDDAVGHLRDWYEQASPEQRAEWRGTVETARDDAIRGRFVPPGGDLEHLTKEQLAELLRAAGQPVTGNKADLIARLTAETPPGPAGGADEPPPAEDPPGEPTGGEGQPGRPDGAPGEQPTTDEVLLGSPQPVTPGSAEPEAGTPQGQPGAPQEPGEPSHEPPVTAPADQSPQQEQEPEPEHAHSRRSTPRRSGGTGPGGTH